MSNIISDTPGYEKWELPLVSPVKAKELESIQKQAYREGFALGAKEGREKIQKELDIKKAALQSMIQMLTNPLKELDDEVVEQLSQLSMIVAKQVVRRELHTEQGEIIGIVREAMKALPASTRQITLSIHPDDAKLVRDAFSLNSEDSPEEERWKLTEDPLISRGGCIIASKNSRIDATVEERLNRVISTLLGGERETDE